MDARPTLESVAREAQVSRQTVSNVLNSPDRVAAPTLARVRDAIGRLGYRPDEAARQLRTRRSRVIGLRIEPVLDGVNGVVLDLFRHAITESAQRLGYRVLLFVAADDRAEIDEYDALVSGHGLDAFVVTGTHHGDRRTDWLARHGVAFVTFGRPWGTARAGAGDHLDGDDGGDHGARGRGPVGGRPHRAVAAPHSWVDVDGAAGTGAAVDALVAAGHRRIAFLGWPTGSGAGDDRRAGWDTAARRHGLATAGLDGAAEDGVATGAALARRLLDGGAGTAATGFVCASDSLALGALGAVHERGLRPGADIGVVGFDDTPVAAAVGLSSVAQPVAAAAENCLQLLDDQVRAGPAAGPPGTAPAPPGQRLLAPTFVPRATTAPIDPVPPTDRPGHRSPR